MTQMKSRSFAIPLIISATLGATAFLLGWLNHREEYATFWIIFCTCCLRTILPAFVPGRLSAITYAMDIMLMCVGFILGFWIGRDRWWYGHTVINWTILSWTLLVVLGTPLAWGLNRWSSARRITGPYCRGCRYHLKGVSDWRCPECGRPFTLKELGVSPSELRADA